MKTRSIGKRLRNLAAAFSKIADEVGDKESRQRLRFAQSLVGSICFECFQQGLIELGEQNRGFLRQVFKIKQFNLQLQIGVGIQVFNLMFIEFSKAKDPIEILCANKHAEQAVAFADFCATLAKGVTTEMDGIGRQTDASMLFSSTGG